jgi:hypothetical protein
MSISFGSAILGIFLGSRAQIFWDYVNRPIINVDQTNPEVTREEKSPDDSTAPACAFLQLPQRRGEETLYDQAEGSHCLKIRNHISQ